MKLNTKKHSGSTLFTILLLFIFILFTLFLSGMGAAIYKNCTANLNENYTSRTAIAYLSEKIRQHNSKDSIYLSEIEGHEALVFRELIHDEPFLTYIYHYNNALYELFTREDTAAAVQSGSPVVALQDLIIQTETVADTAMPLLHVTVFGPEGDSLSTLIHYCGDSL